MKKLGLVLSVCGFGLLAGLAHAETPDAKESTQYFQDWQLKCVEQGENKQCNAVQALRSEQGQTAAMINVSRIGGVDVVEFAMPLLLDLERGAQLNIDGVEFTSYSFKTCSSAACFIVRENDEALLEKFRNGVLAQFNLSTFQGQNVELNISLKGFAAAVDALASETASE